VRQDRTFPENGTLQPEADRNSRFKHQHTELVTFRRVTLPEIPSSLSLMYPTHSLLDSRRSD
jgi:hypothetical protein